MVNQKGQAALTDSIYFLLVVSGLSAFLLFFAVSYGVPIGEKLALQYRDEYATSALKTILYSSTPRIPGEALEDATEVDFLLAAMKEDFADNGEFDVTASLIVNNIVGLMEPLADSFDYIYYIYVLGEEEYAFFMLYTTEYGDNIPRIRGSQVDVKGGDTVIYLCKPKERDTIDPLITNVGRVYESGSRMQLVRIKSSGGRGYNDFDAEVKFAMWTSTALPLELGNIENEPFNCDCFWKLELKNANCNPVERICETEWNDC